MSLKVRWMVAMAAFCTIGAHVVVAEQPKAAQPPMDPAKMEAMKQLGSPSEGHKAFEPLVGTWTYTAQFWMAPDTQPQTMTGTATNSVIFDGRFLQQEITGTAEGQPFHGMGYLGYDNIRKEYQSIWFDNMMTGMMVATGEFDPATKTLSEHGTFSCPMTGETQRWFRTAWTVVDPNHASYQSFSRTPSGQEFKSMDIQYTRTS